MEFADNYGFIKHYKIENNQIIVTYLDDQTKSFPNLPEIEKDILQKMLEQAQTKQTKFLENGKMKERQIYQLLESVTLFLGNIALIYSLPITESYTPLFFQLSNFAFSFASGALLGEAAWQIKDLKDLKKYQIFLEMLKDLEHIQKNGYATNNIKELNINTLENYSFRKLQQISHQISEMTKDHNISNNEILNKVLFKLYPVGAFIVSKDGLKGQIIGYKVIGEETIYTIKYQLNDSVFQEELSLRELADYWNPLFEEEGISRNRSLN